MAFAIAPLGIFQVTAAAGTPDPDYKAQQYANRVQAGFKGGAITLTTVSAKTVKKEDFANLPSIPVAIPARTFGAWRGSVVEKDGKAYLDIRTMAPTVSDKWYHLGDAIKSVPL